MNQWLLAFVIVWLGTGVLITTFEITKLVLKGRTNV